MRNPCSVTKVQSAIHDNALPDRNSRARGPGGFGGAPLVNSFQPSLAMARGSFANPGAYDRWAARWRARLVADGRETNARAKAMRPSIQLSSHAIIAWSKRSKQRSAMETFRHLSTC